jgi:hypothetical protein
VNLNDMSEGSIADLFNTDLLDSELEFPKDFDKIMEEAQRVIVNDEWIDSILNRSNGSREPHKQEKN